MLESVREWLKRDIQTLGDSSRDLLVIRGIWSIDCNFQSAANDRRFHYGITVAQTLGQGACYSEEPLALNGLTNLIGQPYSFDMELPRVAEIAILDAIAASFQRPSQLRFILNASSLHKSEQRARVIVNEAIRLRRLQGLPGASVCNIGAVPAIIRMLLQEGFLVSCSDLDGSYIGNEISESVAVEPGSESLRLVAESDIAIVTGMTLVTNSLKDIMSVAAYHDTRIILFAETGSSFASYYLEQGVDTVVSEPFPFYIFNGQTTLEVYRKA